MVAWKNNKSSLVSRVYNYNQEKTKWRNGRLTPKTPDYQLGWAVMDASRLLDTLKRNFCFMQWKLSQPTLVHNIFLDYNALLFTKVWIKFKKSQRSTQNLQQIEVKKFWTWRRRLSKNKTKILNVCYGSLKNKAWIIWHYDMGGMSIKHVINWRW